VVELRLEGRVSETTIVYASLERAVVFRDCVSILKDLSVSYFEIFEGVASGLLEIYSVWKRSSDREPV
jgi:hypothetical protein